MKRKIICRGNDKGISLDEMKNKFIFIFGFILWIGFFNSAFAVTYDNSSGGSAAGGTSISGSYTVNTDLDGLLIVTAWNQITNAYLTGVTYAGLPLTQLPGSCTDAVFNYGGSNGGSCIYYLVDPPAGTANIVVSASAGTAVGYNAESFNHVDQSSPIGGLITLNDGNGLSGSFPMPTASSTNDWLTSGLRTNYSGAEASDPASPLQERVFNSGGLRVWDMNTQLSSTTNNFAFTMVGPQAYSLAAFYVRDDNGIIGGTCDNIVDVSMARVASGTTITNDFANWLMNASGTLEGCGYTAEIDYHPEIGSLTGAQDKVQYGVTPDYNPAQIGIPKSKNLWNYYNATTTKIDYAATITNNADGIVVGSEIGSFNLLYTTTSSRLTAPSNFDPAKQCGGVCSGFGTVGGGSIATASTTIANTGNDCTPASDWTDIGGGIAYGFCKTLNFLFVPNETTQSILNNDMAILESVPPFSWFFLTNAQIAAVANGQSSYITPNGTAVYNITPTTSSTPNNGISLDTYNGLTGTTSSFMLFPANFTDNQFLSSGKGAQLVDSYYNFVLTAFILIVILMLYKLAL